MSFIFFIGFGIVAAIGGIHTALFGRRAQARKRLRGAPRELVDGAVVTLTGTVAATSTLTAPLSGRTVVAFASSARIYEGHGRQRRVVDRLIEVEMVDFVLETREGAIHVEGVNPELEYAPEPLIPRKIDREQTFLRAHGRSVHARDAGFDEVAIEPGMKISVHGALRVEATPGEATYRETARKIVLAAPPGHPLTIGRPV